MQDVLSPDDVDYTDFLPEDTDNSPFYLGVEDRYGFLLGVFNALRAQQELVPKCCVSLRKCRRRLTDFFDRSRVTPEEIRIHINRVQQPMTQRQQKAENCERICSRSSTPYLSEPHCRRSPRRTGKTSRSAGCTAT
jgi:hypothetical protein